MEDNKCTDCDAPIATHEVRCAACWREIEAESDMNADGTLPQER